MENELLKILYPNQNFPHNPFGYIPEKQKIEAAVYNRIFDQIGGPAESFDWRPYAPVRERQHWYPFCVSFSRLNCAETLAKKQGIDVNLSDRELAVISKTNKLGNSLDAVAEAFRKTGVRTEKEVPFTDRMINTSGEDIWKEVFSLPEDSGGFRYKGGGHSWVFGRAAMVSALKYSPLQIAVGLGETWENDVVTPPKNIGAYHAVMLMYIDAAGFMYIQDSIGREFKKLSPDYQLTGCKSFRDLPGNWKDIMAQIEFVHIKGTQEYGFLETTAHSKILHRSVSESHIRVMAEVFGVNILRPVDGSIDYSEARDIEV